LGDLARCGIIRRMIALDSQLAAAEAEIGREIVRLVPHWYDAECGPAEYALVVGNQATRFFNHAPLPERLENLLLTISHRLEELQLDRVMKYSGATDVMLESYATEWLYLHASAPDWVKLIKYLESVSRRTSENMPVALTLLIRAGEGLADITQANLQKFFDRLASSPSGFTYLTVDANLMLIDYSTVEWSQVHDATGHRFYPEFLHPIASVMRDDDLLAHLTPKGDLVIMNKNGVLATKRKKKWRIYDAVSFTNSLAYCVGSPTVAANLIEVVFDLSYRRQGALLIYDPEHRILERILNPQSILLPRSPYSSLRYIRSTHGQSLIQDSIADIAIGGAAGSLKKKRLLLEMSSIDGAVVFDDQHILAVGALIRSHPNSGNHLGARVTAAKSAHLWGAHPIAVSSDGDVSVYFTSRNGATHCDAVMHFL